MALMKSYIIKPLTTEQKKNLLRYCKQNQLRFVFYAYGTTVMGIPHHELHVHIDDLRIITLIEITISELILSNS